MTPEQSQTVVQMLAGLAAAVAALDQKLVALDRQLTIQGSGQVALTRLVSDTQALLLHVQEVIGTR